MLSNHRRSTSKPPELAQARSFNFTSSLGELHPAALKHQTSNQQRLRAPQLVASAPPHTNAGCDSDRAGPPLASHSDPIPAAVLDLL